jgi:hypothetical protein
MTAARGLLLAGSSSDTPGATTVKQGLVPVVIVIEPEVGRHPRLGFRGLPRGDPCFLAHPFD